MWQIQKLQGGSVTTEKYVAAKDQASLSGNQASLSGNQPQEPDRQVHGRRRVEPSKVEPEKLVPVKALEFIQQYGPPSPLASASESPKNGADTGSSSVRPAGASSADQTHSPVAASVAAKTGLAHNNSHPVPYNMDYSYSEPSKMDFPPEIAHRVATTHILDFDQRLPNRPQHQDPDPKAADLIPDGTISKDAGALEKSITPVGNSPWSISNLFMGSEELVYPSPSLGQVLASAGADLSSTSLEEDQKEPQDFTEIHPGPKDAVEPYFRANITSEVYLTYDTNVSHSLWGHRFILPKFVSVELAEILLSYFCERMAPTFSVCRKHSSSLVCTYLPLAAYDTMVLVALLAWATLHFEQKGDQQFTVLKERLLREVHVLLDRMFRSDKRIPVEVTLATLMIMISIENKGTSSNWFLYYRMAQKALRGVSFSKDTENFKWLKNNLLYHEVTAPSLLTLDDSSEDMEFYFGAVEPDLDDVPEAYMGICRSIYTINRDIFKLSRKLVQSSSVEVLEEVCEGAEILEERIESCKTLEPTEDMVLNGTIKHHRLFFEVLKDTSRLYIRQCVYMVAPVSIKSTMLVGRIMNNIKRLFGTVMDPALLFPLFILGVDTVTSYVREWVINEMKDLHKRVGSGNILVAIELLHKIWERNNEGQIHVFWPQVAKENGMIISLA